MLRLWATRTGSGRRSPENLAPVSHPSACPSHAAAALKREPAGGPSKTEQIVTHTEQTERAHRLQPNTARHTKHSSANCIRGGALVGPTDGDSGINAGDQRRFTPFAVACAGGHAVCVAVLLEASCDTTLACDTGLTGWELAADLRRAEVVAMQPVAEQVTPPHAAGGGGRRGAEEKKRHKEKRGRKTAAAASGDAPLLADSDARRFML